MSAIRVPLLCAFAGGCVSAAILLGVWRADTAAGIPAQQQLARSNELLAAAIAARNAEQRSEEAHDAERASSIAAHTESDRGSDTKAEPAASKEAESAPAGSAVADVLTDLEAAYRKRLGAAAPAEGAAAPAPATEPAPVAATSAVAEPPPAPPASPAPVVALVAPPAIAPAVVAPVAAAPDVPPVAAPVAVVAQNDVRPPDVHYGDVNQNTYITNLRQGDTYVVQQQVAMLQYMQLLGLSSAAGLNQPLRPRAGRAVGARVAAQAAPQYKQFPSTLTNPDNPWGFTFAPPNLVH